MYQGVTYTVVTDHKPTQKECIQLLAAEMDKAKVDKTRMTFKTAALKYNDIKTNVLSESTIRGYVSILRSISDKLKNMIISDITSADVQKEINTYAKSHKAKSVRNMHGYISAVLGMYAPNTQLNTTLPKQLKKEPYIPTDSEVSAVAQAIKGSMFENAVILASFGLRRSEICALTLKDIGNSSVTISKAKVQDKDGNWVIRHLTKTEDGARTIEIPESVADMIKKSGCVYSGHPNSIYKYLSKIEKDLGIQHFSPHKLRHYYASMSHTLGIPDAYIMAAGGWKSDNVLKGIYRHAQKDKQVEMQKISGAYLEKLLVPDL